MKKPPARRIRRFFFPHYFLSRFFIIYINTYEALSPGYLSLFCIYIYIILLRLALKKYIFSYYFSGEMRVKNDCDHWFHLHSIYIYIYIFVHVVRSCANPYNIYIGLLLPDVGNVRIGTNFRRSESVFSRVYNINFYTFTRSGVNGSNFVSFFAQNVCKSMISMSYYNTQSFRFWINTNIYTYNTISYTVFGYFLRCHIIFGIYDIKYSFQ